MKQFVAKDYDSRGIEAARRVLLELTRVLGEYDEQIAVAGGWVPSLLMPGAGHIGSTDVDLALDHEALQEPGYATLRTLLEKSGYYANPGQNFIFYRHVELRDGRQPDPVVVEVDMVAAEYGLAGKRRRSQPVQDLRARKARGAGLVFKQALVERVPVEGRLPNGATIRTRVRVAGPVAFLVMKANALVRRHKPKDAYDIWFLLTCHPVGHEGLSKAVAEHAHHGLVREAMGHLAEAFASVDHVGPRAVPEFLDLEPGTEEYDQMRQDAFQRIRFILDSLRQ